jgi:hypothetical protein
VAPRTPKIEPDASQLGKNEGRPDQQGRMFSALPPFAEQAGEVKTLPAAHFTLHPSTQPIHAPDQQSTDQGVEDRGLQTRAPQLPLQKEKGLQSQQQQLEKNEHTEISGNIDRRRPGINQQRTSQTAAGQQAEEKNQPLADTGKLLPQVSGQGFGCMICFP